MKSWGVLVFFLISALLAGCVGHASSQPALPVQPAPVASPKLDLEGKTVTEEAAASEPEALPVPEPPLDAVQVFGLVSSAFGVYLSAVDAVIANEEDLHRYFQKYLDTKIQIGSKIETVRQTLESFSGDDWRAVLSFAGIGIIATVVYVGRCRTSCEEIFNALWWAASHFASGEGWFELSDYAMSSHAQPEVCGKQFDWERLVETLEDYCRRQYKVTWLSSGVRVEERGRKHDYTFDFSSSQQEAARLAVTVAAGALFVAVIVATAGSASAVIPVFLIL